MNNDLDYKEILFNNTTLADIKNIKLSKKQREHLIEELECIMLILNSLYITTVQEPNVTDEHFPTYKEAFASKEVHKEIEKLYKETPKGMLKTGYLDSIINELTINKNILSVKINLLLTKQPQLINILKSDTQDIKFLKEVYFNFIECGNVHMLVLLAKNFFLNRGIQYSYKMSEIASEQLEIKAQYVLDKIVEWQNRRK